MRRLLRSLMSWSIIDEDEEMPLPWALLLQHVVSMHQTKQQEYTQRIGDAATAIYNACSSGARPYIDHLDKPADMAPETTSRGQIPSAGVFGPQQPRAVHDH